MPTSRAAVVGFPAACGASWCPHGGDLRDFAVMTPAAYAGVEGPHFSPALFGPLNPTRAVTSPAWCVPLDRCCDSRSRAGRGSWGPLILQVPDDLRRLDLLPPGGDENLAEALLATVFLIFISIIFFLKHPCRRLLASVTFHRCYSSIRWTHLPSRAGLGRLLREVARDQFVQDGLGQGVSCP